MIKYLVGLAIICNVAKASPVNIVLTESNSVIFNEQVSQEFVSKKTLEIMSKSLKASPLYLVLDTPGGSVMAGLRFVDSIKSLGVPVHTITIFAASMGYQFVQELGTRYITPSGTLMSHRGYVGGVSGQVPGELNARVGHIQSVLTGMSERAAKRIGISKEAYEASIINELWLDGSAAVKQNHADAIASVKCDKSLLSETYQQTFNTLFGAVIVEFSKCPLISAPVSIKLDKGVKPEDFEKIKKVIQMNRKSLNLTF
jgi:ATP-dependent Clp protease protease subunit